VVQAVGSGLSVQRSLAYGQAVAPLVPEDVAPARGFSIGFVRAEAVAAVALEEVKAETRRSLTAAETRLMGQVAAETTRFSNELLKEGGRVHQAEVLARTAKTQADKVNEELGLKAPMSTISQILGTRPQR
jgi:hypothetical protein